jgi:hypothetical protein
VENFRIKFENTIFSKTWGSSHGSLENRYIKNLIPSPDLNRNRNPFRIFTKTLCAVYREISCRFILNERYYCELFIDNNKLHKYTPFILVNSRVFCVVNDIILSLISSISFFLIVSFLFSLFIVLILCPSLPFFLSYVTLCCI